MKYQPPRVMKELHDIRLALHQERKKLSLTQRIQQTNQIAEQLLKSYKINLKLGSSIKVTK